MTAGKTRLEGAVSLSPIASRGDWLITGSGGYVGTAVLEAFRSMCEGPVRLLRAGRSADCDVRLNLCSPTLALPSGVGTLVHLAAEKVNESQMWAVNRDGTRRLLEAAAAACIKRFVHMSSVGVYGAPMHSGIVDEHFPHRPTNAYEASKEASEQLVRELCPKLGLEWIIVQPTNVLGIVPGRVFPLLGLMRALRHGRFMYFGRRRAWVNYVAVEDVADAIVAAARSPLSGRTWIVNTPAPLDEVVKWAAQTLGLTPPARRVPLTVGRMAAALSELVERLTRCRLPIDRQRLRELTNTTIYDGSAITRDTGFAYQVGIEGLIRSLARYYGEEWLL